MRDAREDTFETAFLHNQGENLQFEKTAREINLECIQYFFICIALELHR